MENEIQSNIAQKSIVAGAPPQTPLKKLKTPNSLSQIAFHLWRLDPVWAGNAVSIFYFCPTGKCETKFHQ